MVVWAVDVGEDGEVGKGANPEWWEWSVAGAAREDGGSEVVESMSQVYRVRRGREPAALSDSGGDRDAIMFSPCNGHSPLPAYAGRGEWNDWMK